MRSRWFDRARQPLFALMSPLLEGYDGGEDDDGDDDTGDGIDDDIDDDDDDDDYYLIAIT